MKARNTYTPEAVHWLAAAIYSQYLHDPCGRLPHYDELPQRLKNNWEDIAKQWLDALFPLLATGIKVE